MALLEQCAHAKRPRATLDEAFARTVRVPKTLLREERPLTVDDRSCWLAFFWQRDCFRVTILIVTRKFS